MEELDQGRSQDIGRRVETIRRAEFEDMPKLLYLLKEMAAESMGEFKIENTVEQLQVDGCYENPSFESWIAWEDSVPVGFYLVTFLYSAVLGKRTQYLEDLYVLSAYRSKGYGTLLFKRMCYQALRQGIHVAWEIDREDFKLRHACLHAGGRDRPHKIGYYLDLEGLRYVINHRGGVFKD